MPHDEPCILAQRQALGHRLWGHDPGILPRKVTGEDSGRPVHLCSTASPQRSMTGEFGRLAMFAGQVIGQGSTRGRAADIIDGMVQEALAVPLCLRQIGG